MQMKKLFLLLPLVILIIGCGGGEKNYFPLAVGNQWYYAVTTTVHITTPDTTFIQAGTIKQELSREATLTNGRKAFEFINTSTIDTMTNVDTSYVEATDDYVLSYDSLADSRPDTTIAKPLEEGKTWTVTSETADTTKAVVIGQESNVQVPAGTYDDVWKVAYIVHTDTAFWYWAPDVGMIKETFTIKPDTDTTATTEIKLTSATIQ
jgi:hypothetical protein